MIDQGSRNRAVQPRTAREVAFLALLDVSQNGAWSDHALHKHLARAERPLSSRDSALAARLVYGTLQNQLLCDWYLRQFSSIRLKKIAPSVRLCLRMGLYQLFMLDKIPAHAAVNETVSLARRFCASSERTIAFVNAVMRRAAQAAKADALPRLDCPDKESYYALRYSHPEWLVRLFAARFGLKGAEALCQADNAETPTSVRVNRLRMTPEAAADALRRAGAEVMPHEKLPEILLCQGCDVTALPLFREGKITIQDAASVVAVDAANPRPGMFVLDCCAAPGGKSFLIAERMQTANTDTSTAGAVISCDVDRKRLDRVQEGAARLGVQLQTCCKDMSNPMPDPAWRGRADIVVCDVPCSGFGVIRKKPEIRYKDPAEVEGLPALQLSILRACAAYVRPGGTLLYSTCTILERENEAVVRAFLAETPAFETVPWSHPVCGNCPEGFATLLPHVHHTDGFFIAKMRKKG